MLFVLVVSFYVPGHGYFVSITYSCYPGHAHATYAPIISHMLPTKDPYHREPGEINVLSQLRFMLYLLLSSIPYYSKRDITAETME